MDGSFDFNFDPPNTGEYVLVASSEETIWPGSHGTEVLNEYVGVVYEGDERTPFGSVVATVADSEARKAETRP
jgi:hypothetical protein